VGVIAVGNEKNYRDDYKANCGEQQGQEPSLSRLYLCGREERKRNLMQLNQNFTCEAPMHPPDAITLTQWMHSEQIYKAKNIEPRRQNWRLARN
jgi:hypothetical protein